MSKKKTRLDLPDTRALPKQHPQHPVYRTPGITFTPRRIDDVLGRSDPLPASDELMLWRFRAEWEQPSHRRSPQELPSKESQRLTHSPSAALRKRHLVSQVFLRTTLSRIFDCPTAEIELRDHPEKGPQLRRPRVDPPLTIQIAYAGIWVLLGISRAPLGISTLLPHAHAGRAADSSSSGDSIPWAETRLIDDIGEARDQARRESALRLLNLDPVVDALPKLISHHGATSIAETADGQYIHTVDIPMLGKINAAVATHEPLSTIHAFGWPGR